MNQSSARDFAAAWSELEAALDWALLGRLHCHQDGDGFFGPAERAALFDAALAFADDLGGRLAPGGRSLYVGAGVAELVPILVESLVLARAVEWHELEGPLAEELARGLAAASERTGLALPRIRTDGLPAAGPDAAPCDHVWLVSVLTDPDAFPALHDRLYGRAGGELATGRGDLEDDAARANALVETVLARLDPPGWLTTTDEELELLAPACARHGLVLEVPPTARLSPVVGDPVRCCRVAGPRRAGPKSSGIP